MSEPQPPRRRVNGLAVVGGVLLGVVLAWGLQYASLFVPTTSPAPWFAAGIALVLAGVAVLLVRGWRSAGAGLVMGLAIGSIVGAGSCLALFTPLFVGLAP